MLAGTTIVDPARIDIRGELECGRDVTIDVGCVFEGAVRLEDGARVGPYCVLRDVTVGRGHAHRGVLAFRFGEHRPQLPDRPVCAAASRHKPC